ncbi:MAG TPA: glycosyl hydrolase, partial [Telluria sp.]|nr:glycosyl hydrolase [Telluria sp.]
MLMTSRRLLALASLTLLASCASNGGPSDRAGAAPVAQGQVGLWVTTGERAQLLQRAPDLAFSTAAQEGEVVVDASTRYQEMVGFGAALTDASAWLLVNKMTPQARTALL